MSLTTTDEMDEVRRKRRGISRDVCSDIVAAVVATLITAAGAAATPFATIVTLPDGFLQEPNTVVLMSAGFLTSLIYVEALRQGGYFRFDQMLDPWGTLRGVVWRFGLILLSFIAACYSLGLTQLLSRGWLIVWAVLSAILIIISRFIIARVLKRLSAAGGLLCRRLVFVGAPARTNTIAGKASMTEASVDIVRSFDPSGLQSPSTKEFMQLQKLVEDGMVDDIVVCPQGDDDDKSMANLLDQLRRLPVHVSLGPNPLWLQRGGRVDAIGDVPTYVVQRRPISGWDTFTKAVEDRVLGFLMLLALLPVMLICAIAVKLDSKGPVFFVQRRQGMAGDVFPIIKFRSMKVMEDGDDVQQATKDDDRITKVGGFLRKTSLDELPQLFNVLKGEMSLVGPRPHALKHDEYYSALIKDYAARHRVKPGMTGWAQVNGFRGETNEPEKMEQRLRYDLEYIENWSLWFDLRVLIKTVKAVAKPENAY
ncbi:undecaprenyl-phosphate glucose phosphotransferase [Parvularcula sp. ZS-1/3]|uniref:Undecaprenyl-phosphate glucose phosphotransferase n=1 Tax=Parvularcula mediterranea TaxID=2732508 RepID=A0A7Y3RM28_9PROT|nr:undecaprenyl-phosphate glucose phosphotransferase [Parvularcula mediterranea]NNU16589.1 undecaprenyl-phosphate glucose phosphotransferase [Parvularcula mediterranea]